MTVGARIVRWYPKYSPSPNNCPVIWENIYYIIFWGGGSQKIDLKNCHSSCLEKVGNGGPTLFWGTSATLHPKWEIVELRLGWAGRAPTGQVKTVVADGTKWMGPNEQPERVCFMMNFDDKGGCSRTPSKLMTSYLYSPLCCEVHLFNFVMQLASAADISST